MQNILNFLNQNSDAITAISALIVAGVAIWGVNEWKKQIKGKTNYEIARRYLKAGFKLRNQILYVRDRFMPGEEIKDALKESGLKSDTFPESNEINKAVYSKRWKKVQEAWSDLNVEILDAEASWGKDAVNASLDLAELVKELFVALNKFVSGRGGKDEIIYASGDPQNPDDFSKKINDAISKIETFLKPNLL